VRLPWPFGRRTPSDGQPSSMPEDARDGASPVGPAHHGAVGRDRAPALAPATGAWATLPPIQRTVGAPPLVAPAGPFLADVPGHRPLPPIVQPLGHDTGPSAPPGLVVAHVSTVPSLTSRASMPTRSVQRHAPATAAPSEETTAWMEAPVGADRAATQAGSPSTGGSSAASSAAGPIRHLAAVAPGATVTPAARPMTQAPAPVAVAQRSSGSPVTASPASSASGRPTAASYSAPGSSPPGRGHTTPALRGTGPVRTVGRWAESPASTSGVPPAGLGAPLGSTDAGHAADAHQATSPASATGAAASSSSASQPPLTAASRRAGLGAPLANPPASSVAQRLPVSGLALPPGSSPAHASAGSPPPSTVSEPASRSSAPDRTNAPAAARALPVLRVSRLRSDEPDAPSAHSPAPLPSSAGGPAGAVGAMPAHATPVPAQASALGVPSASVTGASAAAAIGTHVRPTMGLRPLRTGVTAQRETGATTPVTGTTSTAREAPSVPARWASGSDLPVTVRSLEPSSDMVPEPDAVPLQRLADLPTAAAPDGAAPDRPREMVFPARDASMGMTQWPTASPEVTPGIAGAPRHVASDAPSGSRAASWAAQGPTRNGAQTSSGASRGSLALARQQAPAAPVVSRTVFEAAPTAARPSVQTSGASSGGTAIGGITATPIVQRVDGAAPAAPSAEGHSETELDELARALFGRIRTHLRADVIHEREAKGLTFDAF